MTTASSNGPWAHANDTDFQTWIQEFNTLLTTAGVTVAADTGQLNLATATRPGVNAVAGFKMYKLDDSLFATAPIYIKVQFGTGTASTTPKIIVSAGNTTNGAGTLTGAVATSELTCSAGTSAGANVYSRAVFAPGFMAIAFKTPVSPSASIGFSVGRSFDGTGAPDGLAFMITGSGSTGVFTQQQVIVSSSTVSSASGSGSCNIIAGYTSSVVGTDVQFWKHYIATPRGRATPGILTTNLNDTPQGTERSLTVVGATARNYISVGSGLGRTPGANASIDNSLMMLWE